jgi:lysylphosphatidylglycerol synthetase-like protein (DUF2156 family)
MPYRKTPWILFVFALFLAAYYILHTSPTLPPLVASHFDAAGTPNAFMARNSYERFMLGMSVGFPMALVAFLTLAFSFARNIKVPHRDYWFSPQRSADTRAFLIGRAAWFGVLLSLMMCFVHRLELNANASIPPHLAGTQAIAALLGFFLITAGWIFGLMAAFRRP